MTPARVHPGPAARLLITAALAALALTLALPFARADGRPLRDRLAAPGGIEEPPPSPTAAPLSDPALRTKIDPPLLKRLLRAAPDERIPIVVEMRQQADWGALPASADKADRARAIVQTLQAAAAQSQAGARAFLDAAVARGRAGEVRSFWIFNGLSARLAAGDIASLAAREDVGLVREDAYRRWVEAQPDRPSGELFPQAGAVEWGVHQIRADEVWSALGVTGTGVTVASMDTGVDWNHPALQSAYRGYDKGLAHHAGNWFDATGGGAQYPIDPNGHGTHTMGTMVGSGGIGVAPGARWFSVRIFNPEGFGFDSWIHAGFQWMLAPDGDPSLAPEVLNNSWGNPASSLTVFQNDLRALRAAGVFAVFSAGNNGPDPGSVGSPASLPEAFAVGATDSDDDVARFSSRGPSPWGETRPQLAAPGVGVRSSVPGGAYDLYSGTSMAAPHVAGAAALMLSAHPGLTITDTAFALTSTAVPLSATLPNNDSGFGRVDAFAAVQTVASYGLLTGRVARSDTSAPLAGATVVAGRLDGSGGASASAGADGRYAQGLAASAYAVSASAFGYMTVTRAPVFVVTGTTTPLDFALAPLPTGAVGGALTDAQSGRPLSGTIYVLNTPVSVTASPGYRADLPAGAYQLRAVAPGHRVLTASIALAAGQVVTRDFALPPAPTILLVDSGPWYYGSQIDYYRAALDDLGYVYDEWRVKHPPADVPISATLAPYDVVIWSAPLDAPGLIGAGNAISEYLGSGGSLLLSGQDVGYYDGGLSLSWSDYYFDRLKARAVEDDSGSRAISGTGVFAGIAAAIAGPGGADNQAYPDAIASANPDFTADAFTYANGKLAGLATGLCLPYRSVYLSFGLEAMTSAAARRAVIARALSAFDAPRNTAGMTLSAADDVLVGPAGSAVTQTLRLRNLAELGAGDVFTLTAQSDGWSVSASDAIVSLAPCASRFVTLSVSIPPDAALDASQRITLTARSALSPALAAVESFTVKAPAAVLLIDDDRWYDVEGAYQDALTANGVSFDHWDVSKNWAGPEPDTPSVDRMSWYPFVVWFTGYDWYQPLTARNELSLTQYLSRGGRLLISSQSQLGWSSVSDFMQARLGVLDADYVTTTLARGVAGGPFDGLGALALSYPFPNFSESAAPYPTATVGLVGSHGRPIAVAHGDGAGKAMFLSFPFEALLPDDRPAVMDRALGYLSWLGDSSVRADKRVAAPGSIVVVEVVARNDGPGPVSAASFTATLPAGAAWVSGLTQWSGSLAPGQAATATFKIALDGGLAPGGLITIPVTFRDGDHRVAFHREARIGVGRPDLAAGSLSVAGNPARAGDVVTWTVVARNVGLSDAPAATITGLLPVNTLMMSGTLAASAGMASEVSGTVEWRGPIPAGGQVTLTYQMTVPGTLADRLHYGGALFDDGATLSLAGVWLGAQPHRYYLPVTARAP